MIKKSIFFVFFYETKERGFYYFKLSSFDKNECHNVLFITKYCCSKSVTKTIDNYRSKISAFLIRIYAGFFLFVDQKQFYFSMLQCLALNNTKYYQH